MKRWKRVARGGIAAGLVVVSGIVLDPAAGPAAALAGPLPPLTYPAGAISSSTGVSLTGAAANTFIAENPALVPELATAGPAAEAVGMTAGTVAGTAFGGLLIGTSIGTETSKVLGLPTTGNFVCDVMAAFNGVGCSIGKSQTHVADSEVTPLQHPGWDNPPVYSATAGTGVSGLTIDIEDGSMSTPNFGASGLVGFKVSYGYTASRADVCNGRVAPQGGSATVVMPANMNSLGLGTGFVAPSIPNLANSTQWWPNSCTAGSLPKENPVTVSGGSTSKMPRLQLFQGPTLIATYYPKGDPMRPPDVDPHPARQWVNTYSCIGGGSGMVTSATFHEGDAGAWPQFPAAPCASGPSSFQIDELNLSDGTTRLVYKWVLPTEVGTTKQAYPDCAAGTCELQLERQKAPNDSTYLSCLSDPTKCLDWWNKTNHGTSNAPADTGDRYRCMYGPHELALTECSMYAHIDTKVYSNPKTGDPLTDAPTDPNPNPNPDPNIPQDPDCPPPFAWSSLVNPWWYYKSITCGLEHEFVPQGALDTDSVRNAWNATSLGSIGGFFGTLTPSMFLPPSQSCGPLVDTSLPVSYGGTDYSPQHFVVTTCDGWWQSDGVHTIRGIIGVAFILGAAVGGVRMVLKTIRVEAAEPVK
ncbi:hypothetical protein [Cellulomonas alba]|uniref:Uncharacterized protein n=1 Tax=Cellulomonas alba TaxID=3053467 RepID=A0ABT7SKF1_9CELL|nr:hypothetical protein [Cellulomonas alba]MDM7856665.1 hypothetical protein [Cellulomonas alba]